MHRIFRKIKTFFTSKSPESTEEFAQFKKMVDELGCMFEELSEKEALQRKEIESLQDYILKMGLDVPGQCNANDTSLTAHETDELDDLLGMYSSIIRKLLVPVVDECEKAGTDAVNDLVKTVDKQMAELS